MRKKMLWVLMPVLVVAALLPFGCKPIPYYLQQVCKVYGKVTEAGSGGQKSITSAEVFVGNYQYSELTNYLGDYELELTEGTWTINVHKKGYEPFTAQVTVGKDKPRVPLDVELVPIVPEVPFDLTGLWSITMTLADSSQLGPFDFFMRQTGTILATSADVGLSGTIEGSNVTLQGAAGTLIGSISQSGDEISGTLTSVDFGNGTFIMTRSTLPFGNLTLTGNCAGVPVSMDSDYAYGNTGTDSTYSTHFGVSIGPDWAGVRFDGPPLSVGHFDVYPQDQGGDQVLHAEFVTGQGNFSADGGYIDLTEYDASHMIGTYNLTFSFDGSYLSGSFNVVFGSSGLTSIDGVWQGTAVSGNTAYADSGSDVFTWSHIFINAGDDLTSATMWLNFGVPILVGTYTMPNQAWGSFRWVTSNGIHVEVEIQSGSLTITRYDGNGAAGTFQVTFAGGGTLTGNFDVPFRTSSP